MIKIVPRGHMTWHHSALSIFGPYPNPHPYLFCALADLWPALGRHLASGQLSLAG